VGGEDITLVEYMWHLLRSKGKRCQVKSQNTASRDLYSKPQRTFTNVFNPRQSPYTIPSHPASTSHELHSSFIDSYLIKTPFSNDMLKCIPRFPTMISTMSIIRPTHSPAFFELQAMILILSAATVSLSNLNVAFFRIKVHTSSHDRYTFKLPCHQLTVLA